MREIQEKNLLESVREAGSALLKGLQTLQVCKLVCAVWSETFSSSCMVHVEQLP